MADVAGDIARLAELRRRFPAPLADRRGSHLCRVRARTALPATARRAWPMRLAALTEERAGGAKWVFHSDIQGSVAKSTHAGIPWLRFIRQRLGARVHFWPFDGWDISPRRSAIAEVYPALWRRGLARRGPHGRSARCLQHRCVALARRLRLQLAAFLNPDLSPATSARSRRSRAGYWAFPA